MNTAATLLGMTMSLTVATMPEDDDIHQLRHTFHAGAVVAAPGWRLHAVVGEAATAHHAGADFVLEGGFLTPHSAAAGGDPELIFADGFEYSERHGG